jgi:predicted DNA-binding transcriptional regulator AlpA
MKKPFKRPPPPRRRPVKVKTESVSPVPSPSKAKIIFTNEVLARTGNPSKVTLWRWIKRGIIPPPRVLGGRNTWTDTQIDELLNNLPRRLCYREVA